MSRRRPTAAALALCTGAALALPAVVGTTSASAAPPPTAGKACPTPATLTFAEPTYVDTSRAGGEPLVATLPDGRLIYSAHAGTTHFFAPEVAAPGTGAFVENYTNQTYVWTSDDNGKSWTFRPRFMPPDNAPLTGFSDPEVAIDAAGNVFFSEINLANVAMSKSGDNSENYTLQNFFGAILTDRQWMEADREDELYFVANAFGGGTGIPPSPGTGHYIAKSTDGGKTFSTNVPDVEGGPGIGDIRVDKRTGTVYETHFDGSYGVDTGTLSMASFRNARSGDLEPETTTIAEDVNSVSHWPAFDLDPEGNLYVVWDESGRGERDAGIWFATSKDGARTWTAPIRVDTNDNTDIWPWLAVGDNGRVAISWLEADVALPDNDAQTEGDHGWRIVGAATTTGLGCAGGGTPSFSVATATKEPVHTGTICQGGTTCQARLIDRRLGDYFSMEVDGTGRMYMGYSDTRTPGAVSLPGFVRQSGGPSLLAPKSVPGKAPTATTGQPAPVVEPVAAPGGALPATGATALLPWSGAFLLLGLGLALRRRRTA
ncbi:MAG: hypothetical protein JWM62_2783 [Frankiales bacterium]|nr:hypothetical protein [Frankiales bacterium]